MRFRKSEGSVLALCVSSAALFFIGVAFVGYWRIRDHAHWGVVEQLVAGLALVGLGFLGLVPWKATNPVKPQKLPASLRSARRMLVTGTAALLVAVVIYAVRTRMASAP
ncbi:hypothetical protein ACFQ3P_25775 [Paraburkholderia sabiae]|uniref:Uncharacterized protein n=1 Tax=Paraburkholderia sabiae TaxID=273251 RepID=A0ABU9QLS5_9BURK|nr:hypothetical protein [Paraburkholderia sabiae]WJZ77323.1 hypothetical protein QEN71_35210 [Paraburkholderia sabiae]CAD6547869.1 hypothetical protein LMG24235_04497 [Paraburkholderia sabiae]